MKCYVWSALLCSAETWTLTPSLTRQLEALEMWTYRRMLRIPWTAKVTNERVLNRVNEKRQIMNMIRKRKLSFFGHLVRRENIHRRLQEGYIEGRRPRGRPRISWYDNIRVWKGMSYAEAVSAASDRRAWRAVICASPYPTQEGT